jgi:hypothetical protein
MAQKGCRTAHRPPGGAAGLVSAGSPEAISIAVGPIAVVCQGITFRTEPTTLTATVIPGVQAPPPREPAELDQETLSLAAKVFQLLSALNPNSRLRKAPPIKVFLLRFRQNISRSEIARSCHCSRSLVALRLKTIREKLPWKPQQLRELSAHVEAMERDFTDTRARHIYRKGAAYGEEEESQGDE